MLVFTVPMAHLRGIPTALRERFGVPVVFYDGDVPMSLPEFGGMDTGFNYYYGADPGEYDLVVSNSEGGLERLRELGARARRRSSGRPTPSSSSRCRSRRSTTSSSTATATSSGASGCASSSASRRAGCRTSTSRSAARTSRATSDARTLGVIPFNAFNRAISASRVALNVTRRAHATVRASSTARPFELAMAGAAIVSNPSRGSRRGSSPAASCSSSRTRTRRPRRTASCSGSGRVEELGARARERALDEHTYAHRARRLLELIGLGVPETVA